MSVLKIQQLRLCRYNVLIFNAIAFWKKKLKLDAVNLVNHWKINQKYMNLLSGTSSSLGRELSDLKKFDKIKCPHDQTKYF